MNKAVIDTSSLLSLVRYYLPFDLHSKLFDLIKKKIADKEIILLDKVIDECKNTSKGIVMDSLSFLTDKAFIKDHHPFFNTESMIAPAPAKFLNQLDNTFVNGVMKNKLTTVQYDSLRNDFLISADAKLIIYCLNQLKNSPLEKILLVTEETETNNDKKVFQKIPAICKFLDIEVITLPELLNLYKSEINLEFR
ncbi:MAG TPA: DUF4411 family protein [Ferruginibacter sp.]|nr:DUF4411 family protein [Ferruginibacter sp.]